MVGGCINSSGIVMRAGIRGGRGGYSYEMTWFGSSIKIEIPNEVAP